MAYGCFWRSFGVDGCSWVEEGGEGAGGDGARDDGTLEDVSSSMDCYE